MRKLRPRHVWSVDALCVTPEYNPDFRPDLWFPSQGGGAEARAVCRQCPVRFECLTTAVVDREEHGIWGAAGELTRRRLRRILDTQGATRMRIAAQDHLDRLDEAAAKKASAA